MLEDFKETIAKAKDKTLKKIFNNKDKTTYIRLQSVADLKRLVESLDKLKISHDDFDLENMTRLPYDRKTLLSTKGQLVLEYDLLDEERQDIITVDEIREVNKLEDIKKSDLRTGLVVKLKNGKFYIVFGSYLVSSEDSILIATSYDEDLRHKMKTGLNVFQVYNEYGTLLCNKKFLQS